MKIKKPDITDNLREIDDIRYELSNAEEYETDFELVRISKQTESDLSFGKVYIKNSTIENCRFRDSDFSECTFINVIIKGCDLSNCNFNNTYFKNCLVLSSKLVGSSFKRAVFNDVTLAGSFCIGKCNRTGVTVQVDDDVHVGITKENFKEFFEEQVLNKLERN